MAAALHVPERSARLVALLLVLCVLARAAIAQQAGPGAAQVLLLGLRVNGVAHPGMLRAVRLPEGLALPQSLWDALQLKLPQAGTRRIDGEPHVLLAGAGAVRWRVDEPTQTLEVEAPAGAFVGAQRELLHAGAVPDTASAWAPFFNYDLQWQRTRDRHATDMLWELGLFGPAGDFSSTGLSRAEGRHVRLETRWQRDDPARAARLRVGDSISQAGAWGRSLRYGGVQWGTDFSLQPGFLPFPLPSLSGASALPSTLDLYVNNSQRAQTTLPAGAFDLRELPVVTGQGEIRAVVRDLLGREQVIVLPYYVSPTLLKPGLSAVGVDLGAEREDFGTRSNRYGRVFGSVTQRAGITATFTRELRVEASARQQAAGATGWLLWPALGTLMGSVVASRSHDAGGGWMVQAGLNRQAGDWSGNLQWRHASARFGQLGDGAWPAARQTLSAAIGTSWGAQSFGASFVRERVMGFERRIAQVNASRDLHGWGQLRATLLRDFGRRGGSTVALSWSRPLDDRHGVSLSAQRQPGGAGNEPLQLQAQLQRNAGVGDGLSYQLTAAPGGRQLAQTEWRSQAVMLSGGVARSGGATELRAGASGGLAWLGGSVFAGRRVESGIALVDVDGHAGVRVMHDNQVIARTDERGRAFIATLRGYEPNRIGVVADDLPLGVELLALEMRLTPAARSASYVSFPVQRDRGVTMQLYDAAGRPLPPGTELRAAGAERAFSVGFDGRAYVAGLLPGRTQVQARWPDGRCDFTLELPAVRGDDLPDLGFVTCR
jgi:outer membrane usher protein